MARGGRLEQPGPDVVRRCQDARSKGRRLGADGRTASSPAAAPGSNCHPFIGDVATSIGLLADDSALINNHQKVKDADSAAVRDFKVEASNQLSSRFPLSDEKHPLMIASILDHAHKHPRAFPSEVREVAYEHIRKLVAGVAAPALEPAEKIENNLRNVIVISS